MFGINGGEFVLLVILALVVVGPERLPQYAEQLGRAVRSLRGTVSTARTRITEETGVEWEDLDPRKYDPRRIVREALVEPPTPVRPAPRRRAPQAGPAPFDDEAT